MEDYVGLFLTCNKNTLEALKKNILRFYCFFLGWFKKNLYLCLRKPTLYGMGMRLYYRKDVSDVLSVAY